MRKSFLWILTTKKITTSGFKQKLSVRSGSFLSDKGKQSLSVPFCILYVTRLLHKNKIVKYIEWYTKQNHGVHFFKLDFYVDTDSIVKRHILADYLIIHKLGIRGYPRCENKHIELINVYAFYISY